MTCKSFLRYLLPYCLFLVIVLISHPVFADCSFERIMHSYQIVCTNLSADIVEDEKSPVKLTAEGFTYLSKKPPTPELKLTVALDHEIINVESGQNILVQGTSGTAIGIDARDNAVEVTNSGSITSTMHAVEQGNAIGVATSNAGDIVMNHGIIVADSIASGTSLLGEETRTETRANGVSTGSGEDEVFSDGTVNVSSSAVSVSLDGPSVLITDASSVGPKTAVSIATGINGGAGPDNLTNSGKLMVTSAAKAGSGKITVDLSGESRIKTASTAEARAIGIDGGKEDDTITNNNDAADITGNVDATAIAVGVSLTASGSINGNAKGEVISDSHATAIAKGTAIDGGAGSDNISNTKKIDEDVQAIGTGVNTAVDLTVTTDSNVTGSTLSDASITADAEAAGIDGGRQDDAIDNQGVIKLLSTSGATGVSVSLDVAGTMSGQAEGNAVSDASAAAKSKTTGIDGGKGDDGINNDSAGAIMLSSDANATGIAVGLNVSGKVDYSSDEAGNGPNAETDNAVSGKVLSDSSATANAEAAGIDGGKGRDKVINKGLITAGMDSDATSVSVSGSAAFDVGINVDAAGDVAGMALSDTSATANALAAGIDGGKGDDRIYNDDTGTIMLSSDVNATGVAVGLNVAGKVSYKSGEKEKTSAAEEDTSGNGSIEGVALSDASATAYAEAAGIDGGKGGDKIINKGLISVGMDSDATSVSVSGSAAFEVGINVDATGDVAGMALSDTSAAANALAAGIDGDKGDDRIYNDDTGTITLSSDANATGVAVGLNVAGKVSYAKDEEEKQPSVTQEENTSSSSIGGTALSDSSATADAMAEAIDGGKGSDKITNGAAITADVDSTATSVSVSGSSAFEVGINVDATGDVAGMALSDTSATANALAAGIDGGKGNDRIYNDTTGTIMLSSDAGSTGVAVGLSISGKLAYKGDATGSIQGAALSDTSVLADAATEVINGGDGFDDITNRGAISASAGADATGVAVSVGASVGVAFKGDADLDVSGATVSKATTTAKATTAGIDAGKNNDVVNNTGYIDVYSNSDATGVAAGVNFTAAIAIEGNVKANVEGSALNDTSVTATSSSTGIDGGEGNDTIVNESIEGIADTGKIKAVAKSDAVAVAASLDIAGTLSFKGNTEANAGGSAVSDSSTTANAVASGIRGDRGSDDIDNAGDIELLANSGATGVSAGLNVTAAVTFKGAADADVTGEAVSKANVIANAEATGIDGGNGNDTITNSGDISIMKGLGEDTVDASATGVAASLNITGNVAIKGISMGSASGSAMSEAVVGANAEAIGISSGRGEDTIENTGDIDLLPESDGLGVAASLNVTGNMIGEASGYSGTDSSVTATAVAIGIDGGEDNDTIINNGAITLMKQDIWQDNVDANSESYAASLSITGTMNGSTEGKALSKSTSEATATAAGIDGGSGIDDIMNRARISGDVDSYATALSVSASIQVTGNGVATGAALSDASALANAAARGINGGDDPDRINNTGEIDMRSSSVAESTAVSVNLTASMKGVAKGKAMADGSAGAMSQSSGIDGGAGDDTINASVEKITTNAESSADSTSVTVSGGGTVGLTTGASVSDSSATGEASSTGIDGGMGNDTITLSSDIEATSKAKADADATVVDVKIGAGLVGGYGLADSSASAKSNSTGIDGGDGADSITNTGNITAGANPLDSDPMALATAGSTNVTVGVAAGLSANDAASKSFALAEANALGIGSGSGADKITNKGTLSIAANPLDTQPLADAESDSTTVNIGITIGANNGSASSDSSTIGRVNVAGIDSGSENDTIINTGSIMVGTDPEAALSKMAYAKARSSTVSVGITLGAALGATSAEASAVAEATSTGISSGAGDDSIVNKGVEGVDNTGAIDVGASSLAESSATTHEVKCSFGLSNGDAQSGAATLSSATAAGIDSGAGVDEILNKGTMTVKAFSQGIAAAKTNTLNFLSVGANLQSAHANSSATADALALGIDGGADDDTIRTAGTLLVTANADVTGSSRSSVIQGLGLGVSVLKSQSEAATAANSLALGITGGDGNDSIVNGAAITLTSSSNAVTSAVSSSNSGFTLAGASFGESAANASTSVTADGTGIAGGEGIDEITSNEAISVDAFSTGKVSATSSVGAVTFAGSAGGKALSDASALLMASATGIDGGGADDMITSRDDVTATAVSSGTVSSSSKADADVVFGSASTKTVSDSAAVGAAEASGISGGEGNDTITSLGAVTTSADANLLVTASSVSVSHATFGSAYASAASRASSEANTESTGISGGSGDDVITSKGPISSKAVSTTTVQQTTVARASATFGSAHTLATSSTTVTGRSASTGISGGGGVDVITSDGPITVESSNIVNTGIFVKSSSGPAKLDARTLAIVHAAGIDAGSDNDGILSTDTVLVKGVPRINSFTRNFGSNVQGRVGVNLTSDVKGVTGGRGNDTIVSDGDILVLAGSPETDSTVTGHSAAGSNIFTDAALIGEDPDELVGKWIRVSGDGTPDFITRVEAFDSVTGEMTLRNAIEYDLAAGAEYTLLDYGNKTPDIATLNITVGGYVAVDASTTASVNATGIDGGDGSNDITNTGPVFVRARDVVQAGSVNVGGNINADMNAEAAAKAVGISGADSDDQSTVTEYNDNGDTTLPIFTFIDKNRIGEDPEEIVGKQIRFDTGTSAGFTTVVEGYDEYTGMLILRDPISGGGLSSGDRYTLLGDGSSTVMNMGDINIEANTAVNASGWSISYFGDASVKTDGKALAVSAGISGGGFDESFRNFGNIKTQSSSEVISTTRIDADFGTATQRVSLQALSSSVGMSSGAGKDDIVNASNAVIDVDSSSKATANGVTVTGTSLCNLVWWCGGAADDKETWNLTDAEATSSALGLDLGKGYNTAYNAGDVNVYSEATADAQAVSDVERFKETNADAEATAMANSWGIYAENDEDRVLNGGRITVKATALSDSFAKGAKIGGSNNDLQSTVTEDSGSGSITFIDASLKDQPKEEFQGKWVRFLTGENQEFVSLVIAFDPETGKITLSDMLKGLKKGDQYTISDARNGGASSVAKAFSYGIDLHDGNAIVKNNGELHVEAFASAASRAETFYTNLGQANAGADAIAMAQGIVTGDGDDVIRNAGIIDVKSEVVTTTSGGGATEIATAMGIQTGDGEDIIINEGEIKTQEIVNGVVSAGTAIASGSGNDKVYLMSNSSVTGDIMLGQGDDSITFYEHAAIHSTLNGQDGIDTLALGDRGTFTLKTGDSGDDVPKMESIERFEVNEGMLVIKGDLDFDPDNGELLTQVNGDKSCGMMDIEGNATLGGTLRVVKGPGAFVNGTTYNVMSAHGLNASSFSNEILPKPTPLLSFQVNGVSADGNEIYQVEALAPSFTTVATNRVERAIGKYLDKITPTATGDLSNVIGEFQSLSSSEFRAAFAGLSPGQYDSSTRTTIDVTQQYTQTLLKRIHSLRLTGETASPIPSLRLISGEETTLLAYSGSDQSINQSVRQGGQTQDKAKYGVWLNAFSQSGDQDKSDGFTGYEYDLYGGTIGFDRIFRNRYILGIGIGYSKTDIDLDGEQGDGEIESVYGSVYGSYYTEKGYIDAALSYGEQDYKNRRRAFLDRTAKSDHNGNAFSAFAEGGYNVDLYKWILQPFASLQYIYLDEEGFKEKGAGSINQIVGDRKTESLVSELGLRLAHVYQQGTASVIPEVSAAWNYDFDIDDRVIRTAFAGSPNESFSIRGQDVEKHGATVGIGLTLMNNSGFSTTLKYNGEFRENYQANGVMGELRYEF
jgi:uncharacterized protein YhjY with autotransporter beta-barrel domain